MTRNPNLPAALDHLRAWCDEHVATAPRFQLIDWGSLEKLAGLKTRVAPWYRRQVQTATGTPRLISEESYRKLLPYLAGLGYAPPAGF
jgi:hypothetical protein